jgi:PAS domain S-box-containing protein
MTVRKDLCVTLNVIETNNSEKISLLTGWLDELQGLSNVHEEQAGGYQSMQQLMDGFALDLRDCCWSVDMHSRQLLLLSASAEEIFGMPINVLRAQPQFIWKTVRKADLNILRRTLASGPGPLPVETRLRITQPGGQKRSVLVRLQYILSAAGEPLRVDGLFRDVTRNERQNELAAMLHEHKPVDDLVISQDDVNASQVSIDFERTVYDICEATAVKLKTHRVSVWTLSPDGDKLSILASHDETETPGRLPRVLSESDYPIYFQSFKSAQVMDAAEASQDPRSSELCRSFMNEDGFCSRLDVTIMKAEKIAGVLSIENRGETRNWTEDDKGLAMRVAEKLSQAWERMDRDVAEKDLRLFKTVVDKANFGVLILGLKGHVHYINPTYADMHGFSVDECLGQHFSMFHNDNQLEDIETYRKSLREKGEYCGEKIWHQHRDGRPFPTSMNAKVIRDPEGAPLFLFATALDISEKVSQECELLEEKRKLSTLVASLPGMAFRIRNAPDWPVEMISAGSHSLTGWKPEDLINNAVVAHADVVHPEDKAYVWEQMEAALNERVPYEAEYRIITADDNVKWVMERGLGVYDQDDQLIAVEGFVIDITKRHVDLHALQQKEARYRELFGDLDMDTPMESGHERGTDNVL